MDLNTVAALPSLFLLIKSLEVGAKTTPVFAMATKSLHCCLLNSDLKWKKNTSCSFKIFCAQSCQSPCP